MLKKDKKADRWKSKEEIREEEENVIRGIIADKMDIEGGFAKPYWTDILWIQMADFPLTIYTGGSLLHLLVMEVGDQERRV